MVKGKRKKAKLSASSELTPLSWFFAILAFLAETMIATQSVWPFTFALSQAPEQVAGSSRAGQRAAVAEDRDDLVEVLDLQPVVERVTEAMRPMEKRERAEHEQVDARQAVRGEGMERFVAGGRQPTQREGQAEQEKLDRNQKRGDDTACAEQSPQERLNRFLRQDRKSVV